MTTLDTTHLTDWQLTGELSFSTVNTVLANFQQQIIQKNPPQTIDLSGITRLDSAGLALLIEMRKLVKSVVFIHLPPQAHALAAVSGVQTLLQGQ